MKLSGKTAIVTGGASGFGAGIVRRFVAEGARVVIADINGDAAMAMADDAGDAALGLQVDVANADDVAAMVDATTEAWGGIDILVNNAGVGHTPEPMESLPEEVLNLTWYNASKGWVITATRSMAIELAASGVRVNALNPVAGETPLLKTFMGEDTPEIRTKFLASIPIGRFSTPEDMGAAACFLCSDDASMITGVALEVDGGRCI